MNHSNSSCNFNFNPFYPGGSGNLTKMILQQSESYIKTCMSTWLLCEACIHTEKKKTFPQEKLLIACRDCAASCLGIVSLIISQPDTTDNHAFDCFLYCRECYNQCISSSEDASYFCASACDKCAEAMKELMVVQLN